MERPHDRTARDPEGQEGKQAKKGQGIQERQGRPRVEKFYKATRPKYQNKGQHDWDLTRRRTKQNRNENNTKTKQNRTGRGQGDKETVSVGYMVLHERGLRRPARANRGYVSQFQSPPPP